MGCGGFEGEEGRVCDYLVDVFDAEIGVGARAAGVAECGAVFDAGDAVVVGAVGGARASEVRVAVLVDVAAGSLDDSGAGGGGGAG